MPTEIQRLNDRIDAEVEKLRDELIDLSLRIHASPETAFEEKQAAGWLTE